MVCRELWHSCAGLNDAHVPLLMRIRPSGRRVVSPGGQDSVAAWSMVLAARSGPRHAYTVPGSGGRCHAVDDPSIPWSPVLPVLNIPSAHLKGLWCSGITSASHAEGPGLNPQQVHIATTDPHARLQYGKFFFLRYMDRVLLQKEIAPSPKNSCLPGQVRRNSSPRTSSRLLADLFLYRNSCLAVSLPPQKTSLLV